MIENIELNIEEVEETIAPGIIVARSEERRVGKECA